MRQKHLWAFLSVLLISIIFSISWHVALFEQTYLNLGVYTRMDRPVYAFGMLAWLMEAAAFVAIYYQTKWHRHGIKGTLIYAWLMAAFVAASSLVGVAAKVAVANLPLWFMINGSFIFLHFTLMGWVLVLFERK